MLQVLRNQRIHARTSFGVTTNAISDHSHRPHFGSGQGIGWSGQACAASLNSVARAMSNFTHGLHYSSPDGNIIVNTAGDCFVDDTELGTNLSAIPPDSDLLTEAFNTDQKHSLYWFTTGGLNANDKGSWYYISFHFQNGIPSFCSISDSPAELLTQPKFDSTPLCTPRLDFHQPHKTLGCLVSPNMDPKPQYEALAKIATCWVRKVTSSSLTPQDRLRSYHSILTPQLSYRLSLTCFTYEDCNNLMKIITPTILHASHFHRHFSRTLTHAPDQYGGLRIPHCFYTLIQSKSKLFTYHCQRNDKTGKLLRISIDFSQLQCGLPTPFYNLPYSQWETLITPSWFTHLWSLLSLCSISLSITGTWHYIPPRPNDIFLMELLLPHLPSTSVHYCINACRLHLQILTLADLVTLDGTRVLPHILLGKNFRSSHLRWPKQEIPQHWWSIWAKYITSYISPYIELHRLGPWQSSGHQIWSWFRLSSTSILSSSNIVYTTSQSSRYPLFHPTDGIPNILDTSSLPILDILPHHISIQVLSSSPPLYFDPVPPPPFDYSFLHIHEKFHKRNNRRLATYLRRGTALIATDGSAYVQEKASFAAIITSPKGKLLYSNFGPVLGDPEYLASDRAELMALLAILTRLPTLYNDLHIPYPSDRLHIYSDSEISIKLIQNKRRTKLFSSSLSFELIKTQ